MEPSTLAPRWRLLAGEVAHRIVSFLMRAGCAGAWMPGSSAGATASGSVFGEVKPRHD